MLSEKKEIRVIILAEQEYEDLELWYPKLRLIEAGYKVVVAGCGQKTYLGKKGYPVVTDGNIQDYRPSDFSAIVIPGGWAPDRLRRNRDVLNFVSEMDKGGKVIAAICHGQQVLISANIIRGRNLTAFKAIKDDILNAGANYFDAPVIIDRNLITSRTPEDLPIFCRSIIDLLENRLPMKRMNENSKP